MAPTIHDDGFRLQIYTNDHQPPHAHVRKAGNEVRIALANTEGEKPYVMSNHGMGAADVRQALAMWREIHD